MARNLHIALWVLLPAFAVIAVARPAAPASKASEAQSRSEITRLEHEWLHAESPQVLNRILADDFIDVTPHGFITKQEALEIARRRSFAPTRLQRRFTGLRVRIFGDVGVVDGAVQTSNIEGETVERVRFSHVFLNRDGRWQVINAQEGRITREISGVQPEFP